MHIFLQILIAVLMAACAWWFLRKMLRPRTPAKPADEPLLDVSVRLKRGRKGRIDAAAEPDDCDYPTPTRRERYQLSN